MGETLSACASADVARKELKSVKIQALQNGFIVAPNFYGNNGQMIANTLSEALELARKILE